MCKFISIFIVILFSNLLNAALLELGTQRLDGTEIKFYVTKPSVKVEQVSVLLVLQGSNCSSVYESVSRSQDLVNKIGMARLDIEKYSLDKMSTVCPQKYLEKNTIDQRIHDALRVIQYLRNQSWWNRQLVIVGGSEGGAIAPLLAAYVPETTKLVIMAGGTGWTMREEMLFLLEKRLRSEGVSEQKILDEIKKMSEVFKEINSNPVSDKFYYGDTNTYRWWSSILDLRPLNYMLDLKIPILMVHGELDTAVPVQSARATVDTFKKKSLDNLTYIEYVGLDHSWSDQAGQSQIQKVLSDVLGWILKN